MKKIYHVLSICLGSIVGSGVLLATQEQVTGIVDGEQVPYSPRTHAGLLIDGDEPFEVMGKKWREGALAFKTSTPPPVFERDDIPPFLAKNASTDVRRARFTLESHFWEHKQFGTWYVIPNHTSAFDLSTQSTVVTEVSEPIRHKGYTDRGVYGYEVKITFGNVEKRTLTFSLYEPFKR